MYKRITTNWHFARWLQLAIGGALLWQGIIGKDGLAGMVGLVFFGQALSNTGCLAGSCPIPETKTEDKEI